MQHFHSLADIKGEPVKPECHKVACIKSANLPHRHFAIQNAERAWMYRVRRGDCEQVGYVVEHQGRFVPVMDVPPLQGIMALGDLTGRTLTFSTRKGAADALGLE